MEYGRAFTLQETLAADIYKGREEETLLLLEHPSVYTIGRGGCLTNRLDLSIAVEHINRGGDITWHGPGQLVGYALVDLAGRGRDLHRWVGFLEEMVITILGEFGIEGYCRTDARGVWTGQGKIAFIGVGVRRWITMHGFSLNVCPDLRFFEAIRPCGLADCSITSMAAEGFPAGSVDRVKSMVRFHFEPLLQARLPAGQVVSKSSSM